MIFTGQKNGLHEVDTSQEELLEGIDNKRLRFRSLYTIFNISLKSSDLQYIFPFLDEVLKFARV